MRTARFVAGFFVTPLLLTLASAFAEPAAALPEPAASPTPPQDIMLVLDNSGSMKKNDPRFLMRKMVSAFADGLAPGSRLGLVLFDEKVHRVLGLTAADAPDFKDKIGASLKRINYRGKLTDIATGVERAIYELRQLGRPEAKRAIIFLTDGIVDLGSEARNLEQARWLRESLAEQAKALGIPIFGIALTEAADFQLIQSVAQASGGDYYRVLIIPDILATFEQIRSRIEAAAADPEEPQPEPIAESAPSSQPRPAADEPLAVTDQPPLPKSVSGWKKVPVEWRPWLLLALGFLVLGIVVVGRSRRDKPKVPMPVAMLYDLGSHTKKTVYPLKSITRIGRDKNNDIVIPYNTVSSHHAVIEFRDGLFYLRDLRSTNGSFLNNKKFSDTHAIQEVGLKHGDRIRFNGCEFKFTLAELEDADATQFQDTGRWKGRGVRITPVLPAAASQPDGEPLPGSVAEPIEAAEITRFPRAVGIMPSWQPGEVILDRYEVEEVITPRGRGRIYLTRHRDWKIKIAIKSPAEVMLADPACLACLMQEAKAWTELGSHPNIAFCYFVRSIEGVPHVFVEYVDGGNLRKWIEERRCADLKVGLDLAIQFCHAMAHAHSKGVIHRDIKPENILLTSQGILKVTDFGIGRCGASTSLLAYGDTGKTGDLLGTDDYASPEQRGDAQAVGPETDIFSFGVCLWEMLLGGRPYTTRIKKSIPDPRRLRPDLPARLYALLEALVAFEAEARQALGGFAVLEQEFCTLFRDCFGKPARFRHALERGDLTQTQATYKPALIKEHVRRIPLDEAGRYSESRLQNPIPAKATAPSLPAHREQPYPGATEETPPDPIEAASGEHHCAVITSLATLQEHTHGVTSVNFSPDGRQALSGGSDKTLRLWDLDTRQCLAILEGHTQGVTSVDYSPDGRQALSGGWDKTLRLWDLDTRQCLAVLEGHTQWVTSVDFSPDGRQALSGGWDKTLRLWDLDTRQCLAILEGHTEWVIAVGFSPDGRQALSGGWDKTLRLWDLDTRQCLAILKGHTEGIAAVSFSPDGRQALSGGWDKTLRLWDLEPGGFTGSQP